jgi:hypothetical protein
VNELRRYNGLGRAGPPTAEPVPVARGDRLPDRPPAEAASPSPTIGPVETEAQARAEPAVQAIYAAARESPRRGVLGEGNHRLLCEALDAAGVDLGSYDHTIALWLAGWEPQTVAVIAGWIGRAGAAR